MKFANMFSNISIAAILAASATLSPAQTPALNFTLSTPTVEKNNPDVNLEKSFSASTANKDQFNLTKGLVAHYPFDGDASDMSGNGNHGKVNGAKLSNDRFGRPNSAYKFLDEKSPVNCGNSTIFNSFPLTVTAWFNFNDSSGGSIVSKYKDRSWNGWTIGRHKEKLWPFYLRAFKNQVIGNHHGTYGEHKPFETPNLSTKRWYQIAFSVDDWGGWLYLDGVKVDKKSWTGPSGSPTARHDLLLGSFHGLLDDVRIYDYALSALEVVALHELESNNPTSKPMDLRDGLLAHYPYTGNANDHSGNEHHLEVNGSTPTEDRFGMPNSAYAFDGQDDFMFADIDERQGDFSLSLWAKADDVEQSRYRSVINVFDKTPGSKDTCQIHTSGGRYPTYQFYSSNPESFAQVTTEWQHLAVTVSGKVIRFYENGDRVYSQELEGGEANKFSHLIIGRNRHGGAKYHGAIDDVYVYNRAITDAEVERLFNGGFEDTDGDGLTDDYEKGYGRYQLIKGSYDWKKAKEDAEKRGGHLATITSQAEWEAVREVVGELPSTYWLGGTDEKTEGTWEWITGELWKFTKWSSNEPNNLGNEDYLQTWGKSIDGNRLWNDNQFNENRNGYILEYGYYTDPTLADSDGDRVNDGVEVAAKTDPNNPLSRPAPDRDAPGAPPSAPPGPDYVKKIEELTKDNVAKTTRIEDLENAEKAHLATIAELNATNASLTATVETQKKTIANLNAENADLKQQLSNSREEVVNVSYELTETKEQLQAAIDVARTPFVNGWVYDPEQGWLFTDADHYPLVYSQATQSWHYYELGTAAPRFFYSYKTQEWEAWDPMPEQTETAVASSHSATTNQNL